MVTEKQLLSQELLIWAEKYLNNKYSDEYNIEIFVPGTYLSKLPNKTIKKIPNCSSFDFKPDLLGILSSKKDSSSIELIFINRSTSALSLKEIGEILCYSKIANPIEAFLISPKALANEVNLILLDKSLQNDILRFNDKYVKIAKFSKQEVTTLFPR